MPVHTTYAVPSGSVRIDMDSKPKLAIIVAMVTALGARRLVSVGLLEEIRPDHLKQSGGEQIYPGHSGTLHKGPGRPGLLKPQAVEDVASP